MSAVPDAASSTSRRRRPGSRRHSKLAIWFLLGAAVIALLATLLVGSADPSSILASTPPTVIGVVFASSGAMILARQPGNRIGWLLCAIGALVPLGVLLALFAEASDPRGWPATDLARWIAGLVWAPLIALVAIPLLVLFPDGRPPSPRWRWVLWCAPAFILLALAGNAFADWSVGGTSTNPNPYTIAGHARLFQTLRDLATVPGVAGIVGAVASVAVRYRHAGVVERLQLRWFVTAGALLVPGIVAFELTQDTALGNAIFSTVVSLPAVAVAVAVTRYRLYEIDRIVSRTVTYAVLSVLLVGVYVLGVVGLGGLARGLSGGGGGDLVVAASTLAAAAAFRPLRRRVQAAVDRRFDRARYDGRRTVETFAQRLRSEVDLDAVVDDLCAAASQTMRPVQVGLWLRPEVRR